MKRKLLIVLIFVCLAALVGYLMSRDPGYVLLSWEGHVIQTSIWLMIGVIIVAAVIVHYSFKLLRGVSRAGAIVQDWRENRKRTRSQDLTSRGLLYFQEGNFDRAEKFLISGAENHLSPVFNYIAAAKTADQRGDYQKREAYLRQALEVDARAEQAVAMATAEMAAHRGDWALCLEALATIKSNPVGLNLKWRALYHSGQWAELLALLPQLKEIVDAAERSRLEAEAVSGLLAEEGVDIKSVYKHASVAVRHKPEVIRAYVAHLNKVGNEKEAEHVLRQVLTKDWQSELLDLYASQGEATLSKRLKTAEAWKKTHPDDSALHYCLGRLHELAGDRDKAKVAYEKSIQQDYHAAAGEQLAGLLAFEGDYQQSNEYLKLSLKS